MLLSDESGNRVLHPEGQWVGVCVDVVDMGVVETAYGPKAKVRFVFETDAEVEKSDKQGKPYIAPGMVSRSFTATLNEKGLLRPFLEGWLGRKMTRDEVRGFDPEQLVGVGLLVTVAHRAVEGTDKVYDNIISVARLPKQIAAPTPTGRYVRVRDRAADDNGRSGYGQRAAAQQAQRMNAPAPAVTRSMEAAVAKTISRGSAAIASQPLPPALQDDAEDELPF